MSTIESLFSPDKLISACEFDEKLKNEWDEKECIFRNVQPEQVEKLFFPDLDYIVYTQPDSTYHLCVKKEKKFFHIPIQEKGLDYATTKRAYGLKSKFEIKPL